MESTPNPVRPARRSSFVLLAAALLIAGACRQAEIDPTHDQTAAHDQAQAQALEAQKRAGEALAAELAATEAAQKAIEEREALLEAREEQLRHEESLRAQQARLDAQKAQLDAREDSLAVREKELENFEANLAFQEKELRDREAAAEELLAGSRDQPSDNAESDDGKLEDGDGWGDGWSENEEPEVRSPAVLPEVEPDPGVGEPEPIRVEASLEPGRLLEIEILETLTSRTSRVGDTFSARLVQDLRAEDGTIVVPADAEVIGRVTQVTPLKSVGGRASLDVEFTHIVLSPTESIAISASFVEFGANKRKDKKKIAGAAIVGAILGRVLGGDTDAVIAGAAVGAAAGTAAVARAKGKDAEIPAGQTVALQLEEVVTVAVEMKGPVDN